MAAAASLAPDLAWVFDPAHAVAIRVGIAFDARPGPPAADNSLGWRRSQTAPRWPRYNSRLLRPGPTQHRPFQIAPSSTSSCSVKSALAVSAFK